ncbi:MAG TPA: vWA domain-containing protein [Candidatus Micrarchaeia archaeon]|nr:vWA domain-containing protein [Candidatus Micrarchaeia archaeon]
MSLGVAQPWLLALLAPLAALALVLRAGWQRPGRHRWWTVLQGLAALLVVVSLAQPRVTLGGGTTVVLALDRSASVDGSMRAQQLAWVRAVRPLCTRPCRLVQFARRVAVLPDSARALAAHVPEGAAAIGTRLQRGVETAVALAPPGGRVIVIGDGVGTAGTLLAAAAPARRRGVRVDFVPVSDPGRRDAAVTAMGAPAVVHAGDPLPVLLTVRSTVSGRATLQLARDGAVVASQPITLHAGDNPLLLAFTAVSAGWEAWRARVTLPGDAVPANDTLTTVTRVVAAPRVLVVGAGARPGPRLTGMLARRGLRVAATTAARLPASAAGYAGVDCVVLDDVPAADLAPARVAALSAAVRGGSLGLLVLGGPHSFSAGGYAGTPLQRLLPLLSLLPGNQQRRGIAIELVLDRSGSMTELAGGVSKIDMARVAADASAQFSAAHRDDLGVVAFDVAAHVVVPMERVTPGAAERRVIARLDQVQAGGGTDLYAGLLAGARQLELSPAPTKRMILMTDGISQPATYAPLLSVLRRAHIPVATVALGPDADRSLLGTIARATGGHAYATDSARQLPRIFTRETKLALQPVTAVGPIRVVAGGDSPVVRSLAARALPRLDGNVVTTLQPGAEADLLAAAPGGGLDPALAQWQLGLGRVVAWTPGLWTGWAGAWSTRSALWNDAVRWAERGAGATSILPQVVPGSPPVLRLDLAAAGGGAAAPRTIAATLSSGRGRGHPLRLTEVGAGLYRARLAMLAPGVYRYQLGARGVAQLAAAGEVAIPYPDQFLPRPARDTAMFQLVARTGGSVLAPGRPGVLAGGGRRPLWWPLALAALVLFLVSAFGRQLQTPVVGRG